MANTAPVLDLNGAGDGTSATITFTEGDATTRMAPDATLVDLDSANFDGGTLTVEIGSGGPVDILQFLSTGTGPGQVQVSGGLTYGGVLIGSVNFMQPKKYIFTFNANATPEAVQAVIRQVAFLNVEEQQFWPSPRSVTYTLTDGDGGTATETVSVNIVGVEDLAVLADDAGTTDEATAITISVLANDGDDLDGPWQPTVAPKPLISHVAGQAVAVGDTVTLASGATVTFNVGGTLSYDPNGAFDSLTTSGSGAVNTVAVETFSYTVAGGVSATVTVTVNGLASAGDVLTGDDTDNIITGGAGADAIVGLGGNDRLDGGDGADTMTGGNGDDTYIVDNTADTAVEAASGGTDTVFSSASFTLGAEVENLILTGTAAIDGTGHGGANGLTGNSGANTLDGGGDNDVIFALGGNDTLIGGSGNDELRAQAGADTVQGDAGDDLAFGGPGNDVLHGGADHDEMYGGADHDQLFGEGGDDILYGTNGNDVIDGDVGDDELRGQADTDTLYGRAGSDSLFGGPGTDTLWGGDDADALNGGADDDVLHGEAGDDSLGGGLGDDTLVGGLGADALTGGDGNDSFGFDEVADSAPGAADRILDFAQGEDLIDLSSIDADSGTALDQEFSFIGSGTFTNTAGELRAYDSGAGSWFVEGDTDGDGLADFRIEVFSAPALAGTDFML